MEPELIPVGEATELPPMMGWLYLLEAQVMQDLSQAQAQVQNPFDIRSQE